MIMLRHTDVETDERRSSRAAAQTVIDPEALSSKVPANDVCAGLYMEHLLRSVRNIDDQMVQVRPGPNRFIIVAFIRTQPCHRHCTMTL